MILTQELLDDLTRQAKSSLRLRMNLDMRTTPQDQSQRMLNALEPGTILPIHRHRHSSETVVVLRGKVEWLYYNDQKQIIKTIVAEAGGPNYGISVPAGQWHSLNCLESGTVILECKDGKYEPLTDEDILR